MVALSIGLIVENPRYVFAAASLVIFGFVVIGFLLFPRLNPGVPLRFPTASEPEQYQEKLLVAGFQISPGGFPQQFACVLEPKSWWLLLVLGLLSLGAFCFLVSSVPLVHFVEHHFFESIYLPALLTLAGLFISIKWYSEQSLLANSAATLGLVSGISDFGRYRKIRYEFRDGEGGYYGGIERDFLSRQMDHVVLVVYNRRNPDHSCSSRGFMFRNAKIYSNVKIVEN